MLLHYSQRYETRCFLISYENVVDMLKGDLIRQIKFIANTVKMQYIKLTSYFGTRLTIHSKGIRLQKQLSSEEYILKQKAVALQVWF